MIPGRKRIQRMKEHIYLGALAVGLSVAGLACDPNVVGADPVLEESTDDGVAEGYPDGPYGVADGDIVANLAFSGFFTETATAGPGRSYGPVDFQRIRALGRYRYLLLNVAAEWCSGCRVEAQILPARFIDWSARGGYVMSVIIENTLGRAADRAVLDQWRATYQMNYTMVHDPRDRIRGEFATNTLPINVIIDLETMRIVNQKIGEDLRFLDTFESLLE